MKVSKSGLLNYHKSELENEKNIGGKIDQELLALDNKLGQDNVGPFKNEVNALLDRYSI